MMQILKSGGMQILTDDIRKSDINNPKGYYEYEKTKSLQKDNSWLIEAEGKAVKIIAQLIQYVPLDLKYSVIVMERNIDEIILSQNKMIENLGGKKSVVGNNILKKTFEMQLNKAKEFLFSNSNFNTVVVSYNELLSGNTGVLNKVNQQLNLNLDLEKSREVIDRSLYRNKVTL